MTFLLMLSGVVNTMWMAVHERTREIGTMLALGMRRRLVLTLFMMEAAVMGLAGAGLGGVVGTTILAAARVTGLPVRPAGSELDNYLRPLIDMQVIVLVVLFAAAGAALAAIPPALRDQ